MVVSPIALGYGHELLNVDADQAAASIARAIKADRLLILTDVDGVILDGKVVENIRLGDVENIQSRLGVGMNRKVIMCARAVEGGVGAAIIASGLVDDPLSAIEKRSGTWITP